MPDGKGQNLSKRLSVRHVDATSEIDVAQGFEENPITLNEEEAALLAEEVEAAQTFLPNTDAVEQLKKACQVRVLTPDVQRLAGEIILASLKGGRARKLYLAEGEQVLTALLRKTPQGRQLEDQLSSLNKALSPLKGKQIDQIRVGMRTAGHYTLTLAVEGINFTLFITPEGVALESIGI
jgi:hypothetical protein